MGKGNRNRQLHMQEQLENPQKKKKVKKQAPKWLGSVIGLVLVAAILVGVVANIIIGNGIIARNRVILESQTGEFDVNQQMATFLVWQEVYAQSYTEWYYYYYKIYEDENDILTTFENNPGGYALAVAETGVTKLLRDCVDDIMEMLKVYVAVCDEAYRNNVTLSQSDLDDVNTSIQELKDMSDNYGYASFNAFVKSNIVNGLKEKDIRAALKLQSLYNKYSTMKQASFDEAVQLSDLVAFRDANPEDYYKIDYLEFETEADEKAFAEELAACTTADEFKALILKHHFDENYKTSYNKFTTLAKAEAELETVNGKTDSNEGTALTTALNAISAEAAANFAKNGDYTGKTELKDWLFNTDRKQYNTDVVTTENGVYLVALMSEPAGQDDENPTVSARIKYYEFVSGTEHEGDTTFKDDVFTYLSESKKDNPDYPEKDYQTASDKASAFKKTLEADGADIAQLMKNAGAISAKNLTASSSSVPSDVASAATASDVEAGQILTASDDDAHYVIYVEAVNTDTNTADISYVTFEGDVYYQVIDDLTESLDKVYPIDQAINYTPDAEEGTFEAWISQLSDKNTLTSARKEFDSNYFEIKDDEDNADKITGYTVYMVVNTPMYLETDKVIHGGYLKFSTEKTFADDAANALETLKNETELDLLSALSAMSSDATVSYSITEASLTESALKTWFTSEARQKNDIDVITAADGKSAYVAIYVETLETWESTAKSNYVNEQLQDWVDNMTKDYTPNEKALNKLGQPTPETTEEETTATESTTASN